MKEYIMVSPISNYSTNPWPLPINDIAEPRLIAAETKQHRNQLDLMDPVSYDSLYAKRVLIPEGVFIVNGHGSCPDEDVTGGGIFDYRNGFSNRKHLETTELIKLIKKGIGNQKIKLIVFLSCYGGSTTQPEAVAKALGIPVLAATTEVGLYPNGKIEVAEYEKTTQSDGRISKHPRIKKIGFFKLFTPIFEVKERAEGREKKVVRVIENGFGSCHNQHLPACLPKR
jgi:hypothetical protein